MGHGSQHRLVTAVMDHSCQSWWVRWLKDMTQVFQDCKDVNAHSKTQQRQRVPCILMYSMGNSSYDPISINFLMFLCSPQSVFPVLALFPLYLPSHLVLALLLILQLALVNNWLQLIQAHRMKSLDYSYTLYQWLRVDPSVFMYMTHFASVHPLSQCCCVLNAAYYRFSNSITSSQPLTA